MKYCRDCEYWTEDISEFAGVYRTEVGYCHIEPKKIPKDGGDFCGKFKPKEEIRKKY